MRLFVYVSLQLLLIHWARGQAIMMARAETKLQVIETETSGSESSQSTDTTTASSATTDPQVTEPTTSESVASKGTKTSTTSGGKKLRKKDSKTLSPSSSTDMSTLNQSWDTSSSSTGRKKRKKKKRRSSPSATTSTEDSASTIGSGGKKRKKRLRRSLYIATTDGFNVPTLSEYVKASLSYLALNSHHKESMITTSDNGFVVSSRTRPTEMKIGTGMDIPDRGGLAGEDAIIGVGRVGASGTGQVDSEKGYRIMRSMLGREKPRQNGGLMWSLIGRERPNNYVTMFVREIPRMDELVGRLLFERERPRISRLMGSLYEKEGPRATDGRLIGAMFGRDTLRGSDCDLMKSLFRERRPRGPDDKLVGSMFWRGGLRATNRGLMWSLLKTEGTKGPNGGLTGSVIWREGPKWIYGRQMESMFWNALRAKDVAITDTIYERMGRVVNSGLSSPMIISETGREREMDFRFGNTIMGHRLFPHASDMTGGVTYSLDDTGEIRQLDKNFGPGGVVDGSDDTWTSYRQPNFIQ